MAGAAKRRIETFKHHWNGTEIAGYVTGRYYVAAYPALMINGPAHLVLDGTALCRAVLETLYNV